MSTFESAALNSNCPIKLMCCYATGDTPRSRCSLLGDLSKSPDPGNFKSQHVFAVRIRRCVCSSIGGGGSWRGKALKARPRRPTDRAARVPAPSRPTAFPRLFFRKLRQCDRAPLMVGARDVWGSTCAGAQEICQRVSMAMGTRSRSRHGTLMSAGVTGKLSSQST